MTETERDGLPEQGLLASDAALVDPGAWELIAVTGTDRVGFLHRLLTGKVEGGVAGQGGRTMLLTPKGHPVADLMEDEELSRFLDGIKSSVEKTVSQLPAHQTYVEQYCRANSE